MFYRLVLALLLALTAVYAGAQAPEPTQPIFAFDPSVCFEHTDGGELSPRCRLMIQSYPIPPAHTTIRPDNTTLSLYSFWRVGSRELETPLYSAPGGGVIGTIPPGYNFVTSTNTTDPNYIQILGGEWVRRTDALYTSPSSFLGVEIEDGLQHPFAWVLDMSRIAVSRYPGGPRDNESGRFLQRYERVNIFATAFDEEGWRWYMIGENQWVRQTFVSKVQRIERPEGVSGRWVAVDLYEQNIVAYEDDTPVFATLISSGLPLTETREGLFEVWARLPVDPMSGAAGAPNAYALQSVPWVMYFDRDISLHGSYWHDYFGYRQSRGCVNMTISDSRWLYNWFAQDHQGTEEDPPNYVYVHSSGVYGQPPAAESLSS